MRAVTEQRPAGLGIARNVTAGALLATLDVTYCSSFAAMMFIGPFAADLGRGVAVLMVTTAVVGMLIALRSRLPCVVAGSDGNATAVFAAMAAGLAPMALTLPEAQRFPFLMTILAGAAFLVGVTLYALGRWRLARIVRFVPYPVAGGFIAATGWLVASGAVQVASGLPLSWQGLGALLHGPILMELGLTVAMAAAFAGVGRLTRAPLAMPAMIAAGILGTHAVLAIAGISMDAAQAGGILMQVDGADGRWLPIQAVPEAMTLAPWLAVAPDIAALMVVATLVILLNATGIELATRSEADLDRELRLHGLAHMASVTAGGVIGNFSVVSTVINREAGATNRSAAMTAAALVGAAVFVGSDLIGLLPRFVLAGVLLHLGLGLVWTWAVAEGRRLPRGDRVIILGIVILTANFGFLAALAFGILAGCVIFAMDVSRIGIIRHIFGADEFPSRLLRSDREMEVLARRGGRIQAVVLTSFIFFGSSHRLYERIRHLLADKQPAFIILDLSAVPGIDSSAGAGFAKIRDTVERAGVTLIVAGGCPSVLRPLRAVGGLGPDVLLFDTLDDALEYGEGRLLEEEGLEDGPPVSMVEWLGRALDDPAKGQWLAARLTRVDLAAGQVLYHGGEPTDAMHFVERGRLSVLLEAADAPPLRVRGLGHHTVVGEMGFFLDQPRSAALRADEETVVWELDRVLWADIQAEAPEIASALLVYLVRVQSERLAFANRQVAALQR